MSRLFALMILLSGCQPSTSRPGDGPGDPGGGGGDDTGGGGPDTAADDTGEPWPYPSCLEEVSAGASPEIGAVIAVRWRCPLASAGAVAFGVGDETWGLVAAERGEDGAWSAAVVGLPPDTAGWVRIQHPEEYGERLLVETGARPESLPLLYRSEGSVEGSGYTLTTLRHYVDRDSIPVILDGQGQAVWWHELSGLREAFSSRLLMSPDRRSMVYNVYRVEILPNPNSFSGLVRVRADGSEVERIALPDGHHDFWLHDDGRIAYLAFDIRKPGEHLVAGDRLMIRQPDGSEQTLWSIWDHIPYTPGEPNGPDGELWSIANVLRYDAARDAYWIGFRDLDMLACIDAKTGQTCGILGGEHSDFALTEGTSFAGQHGFSLLEEGVVVFDNRRPPNNTSRVVRYRLDEETMEATQEWEFLPPAGLHTPFFGDAHALPGGAEYLVSWGDEGRLDRLSSDGAVLRSLQFSPGVLGFIDWQEQVVP